MGPSHAGLSCDARSDQLERVAEERQKFQQWEIANNQADPRFQDLMDNERKAGTTRACPKCHRFITKDGGCDHMKCTRCGQDFRWSQAK